MSRVILRFRSIAAILNRARAPIPTGHIAGELEVSGRTVQRDIEFMRDSLELPIVTSRRGVYLAEKVTCCEFCCRRAKSKPAKC